MWCTNWKRNWLFGRPPWAGSLFLFVLPQFPHSPLPWTIQIICICSSTINQEHPWQSYVPISQMHNFLGGIEKIKQIAHIFGTLTCSPEVPFFKCSVQFVWNKNNRKNKKKHVNAWQMCLIISVVIQTIFLQKLKRFF